MTTRTLSGTDSLFLAGETSAWHQHVAGLVVLDPEGRPGFGYERIRDNLDERLPLVPKLRWKLREVPLGLARPVWVDDADFSIEHHMRRGTVDAPGGSREVAAYVGRILGEQLDRSRPLWEFWYLDGLAHGRVAIVMKYHHCLLDGMAGSGLTSIILDLEPDPPAREIPELPEPKPGPSAWELVGRAAPQLALAPVRALQYGVRTAQRVVDLGRYVVSSKPKPDVRAWLEAPRTSFNGTIGPKRAMATASVSLADVKALRRHCGVTVNDIVLAMVAGALRTYLSDHDGIPEHSLTAGIPISIRAPGDDSLDNQVSYTVVPLGTEITDPLERLARIHEQTNASKMLSDVMREHPMGSVGTAAPPFAIGALLQLAYQAHVLAWIPGMMNTVVSNVPGPPFALYMAGARVVGIYSLSVILEGMGVNFTVYSFEDRLDFGLHVDPDLVANPWELADALVDAHATLMKAAGLGMPTPVSDPFSP